MKAHGKGWVTFIIVLAVIALLGLGIFGWYIGGYNNAVRMDEATKTAWANVDAVLQRRLDLLPNLIEIVKGYAKHEKELFENIAQAKTKYFQADTRGKQIEASNELGGFLSRLLMLQERFPELKANQNFLALQDSLEGTENRIAVARTRYNQAAKALNSYRREFFGSFFCAKAGVTEVEYFEATKEAQEVPKVDFGN